MITQHDVDPLLPLREEQMGLHTDLVLIKTGNRCGQASCLHLLHEGRELSVSSAHILSQDALYFTGAKRLARPMMKEGETHSVPALELIASDQPVDLCVFSHIGLDLSTIPKKSYDLAGNSITFEMATKNIGTLAFIHATPGFATRRFEYPDGVNLMLSPIYSAWGPIIRVERDVIVADFAERDLIELNTRGLPQLDNFAPSGGTRDLSGMSGSGLWVYHKEHFHLAGVMRGPAVENRELDMHAIAFTPIWVLKEWLGEVLSGSNQQS